MFPLLLTLIVFACHAEGGEHLVLRVKLTTSDGKPLAYRPNGHIEVTRFPDGKGAAVDGDAVAEPPPSSWYTARIRRARQRDEATMKLEQNSWRIAIHMPGYLPRYLGPFLLKEDGDRVVTKEASDRLESVLLKDVKRWRPEFACLNQVKDDPVLEHLTQILEGRSDPRPQQPNDVYLRIARCWRKPRWKNLGPLNGTGFNRPAAEPPLPLFNRARASLLNIFHVLNADNRDSCTSPSESSWLPFIWRIHVIDEERFIALVDPKMLAIVETLTRQHRDFACNTSAAASAALHGFSNPLSRHWKSERMPPPKNVKSIKTPVCQGNVQITVAQFGEGDQLETFADFDIDESFDTHKHARDVVKHHASGKGTNAFRIGEMLAVRELNRQLVIGETGGHPLNLGYKLVHGDQVPSSQCVDPGRTLIRAFN